MRALRLLVPNHVSDNFPRDSLVVRRSRQLLCIRTHPNPCREASQYTMKFLCMSGSMSIGAIVNLVFNSWKLFSPASVHLNFFPFYVRAVMGPVIFENPSINLR